MISWSEVLWRDWVELQKIIKYGQILKKKSSLKIRLLKTQLSGWFHTRTITITHQSSNKINRKYEKNNKNKSYRNDMP